MNFTFKRYTSEMMTALSRQTLPSLALNALFRGVAFTAMIQIIALLSGLTISNLFQLVFLILIFGFVVFCFDVIEKYWALNRLSKLGRR